MRAWLSSLFQIDSLQSSCLHSSPWASYENIASQILATVAPKTNSDRYIGACPLIHPRVIFRSSYSFLSLNYKYRINLCILALESGQRLLYRLGLGLVLVLVLVLVLRCNAIAQFGWINGQVLKYCIIKHESTETTDQKMTDLLIIH